jgi:hypothetical protein
LPTVTTTLAYCIKPVQLVILLVVVALSLREPGEEGLALRAPGFARAALGSRHLRLRRPRDDHVLGEHVVVVERLDDVLEDLGRPRQRLAQPLEGEGCGRVVGGLGLSFT